MRTHTYLHYIHHNIRTYIHTCKHAYTHAHMKTYIAYTHALHTYKCIHAPHTLHAQMHHTATQHITPHDITCHACTHEEHTCTHIFRMYAYMGHMYASHTHIHTYMHAPRAIQTTMHACHRTSNGYTRHTTIRTYKHNINQHKQSHNAYTRACTRFCIYIYICVCLFVCVCVCACACVCVM